jgi:hypothetical protein
VSASATFTTSAGAVTVDVFNSLANPGNVGQSLSDLAFDLSGLTGTGAILTSSSGLLRTITGTGVGGYSNGGSATTGWVLEVNTTNGGLPSAGLRLCDLCGGASGPAHTIIGPPNGSNAYAAANSSIAGNIPHNPFLFGDISTPVHFVISVPGVTAATAITAARFSFGTTEGDNILGVIDIPEPSSLILLGAGLLGLSLLRRRFRV